MAHLAPADTILLALLAVGMPAYSFSNGRRFARGMAPERTLTYRRSILAWWLIAFSMLLVWLHSERPLQALGFVLPLDLRAAAGAVLCVLTAAYFNGQQRVITKMPPEKLAAVRRRFAGSAHILPRSRAEYRWFLAVALTAGTCEELLYRGYFFAITAPLLTPYAAIVASAMIFGLGHLYQGPRGVVKTGYVGLLLGIAYYGTGSLLWPVLLHVLADVGAGTSGYAVMRKSGLPEAV